MSVIPYPVESDGEQSNSNCDQSQGHAGVPAAGRCGARCGAPWCQPSRDLLLVYGQSPACSGRGAGQCAPRPPARRVPTTAGRAATGSPGSLSRLRWDANLEKWYLYRAELGLAADPRLVDRAAAGADPTLALCRMWPRTGGDGTATAGRRAPRLVAAGAPPDWPEPLQIGAVGASHPDLDRL